MKNYNRLIVVSIVFYILIALIGGIAIRQSIAESHKYYRVEINRILEEWDTPQFSLDNYTYIKNVSFLDCDVADSQEIKDFYNHTSETEYEIHALYEKDTLVGYLRMDYVNGPKNKQSFWILEIALLLLEVAVLFVLFHLRSQLVKPFDRMQTFSNELSKGNLKGAMKADKSGYIGSFQWSLAQLKDHLDISKKRELELLRERKLLLLSLSHDIKTPLSAIELYNRALMEHIYEAEEERQEAHLQIEEKIKIIEGYIREIIKTSHEDLMDIPVEQGEFYLKDLIEKVLSVYQEPCELRKIDFAVGAFDNRIFRGDIHRLLEVFENIFENAFKYGDGRRIEISFSEEDGYQLICIYNSGEPVTENDFSHLFESFYRGNNTHGRNGNGLGLYICREIMHKMGGEIYARIEKDGMSFVLVLA